MGKGVHVAPAVVMGSSVIIKDYAVIGIGSSIATGVKIGTNAIVGVGAGVIGDIPDNAYVEGVPAKETGKRK